MRTLRRQRDFGNAVRHAGSETVQAQTAARQIRLNSQVEQQRFGDGQADFAGDAVPVALRIGACQMTAARWIIGIVHTDDKRMLSGAQGRKKVAVRRAKALLMSDGTIIKINGRLSCSLQRQHDLLTCPVTGGKAAHKPRVSLELVGIGQIACFTCGIGCAEPGK